MAEVNLKLKFEDGTVKEFRRNRVSARWLKEGFKFDKRMEKPMKEGKYEEVLDARIGFVVGFFNDTNLTAESIWDGLESDTVVDTINDLFSAIVGNKKAPTASDGKDKEPEKS